MPAERRQLRLFLLSPYFNNTRNAQTMLTLYDHIVLHDADERQPALAKAHVSHVFFPNTPFQEKEKSPLDSLASELFLLVRRFLAQQQHDAEKTESGDMLPLMRFYRKHGLEERFWQTAQSARKIREETPVRGADYFLEQLRIEEEISNFQGIYDTHEDDANLNAVNYYLDAFFSVLKMEYTCALYHRFRHSQMAITPTSGLTQAVLEFMEQENHLDIPLAKVYSRILSMLQIPTDENLLSDLENNLAIYKEAIPPEKYRDLQAYYRFFWGRQYLRSGDTANRQRMFDILEAHLREGYFYIDHKLTPLSLRLLLNFGLKLGKYDWVKKLLDAHTPERICGTKYPEDVHNLNVAEYHFYKKEYAAAEEKLTYRPFENPNFSILADVLLIKIYFETADELLDSRMKALDQKVRRTKLAKETKDGYYNFLKKLDKVVKYGWQINTPKREKLVEEIRTTPGVFAREWLLEKLNNPTR